MDLRSFIFAGAVLAAPLVDAESDNAAPIGPIEQLLPATILAKIKGSLPQVADPKVQAILSSPETLWYDGNVMTESYQDSVGANTNAKWPDLVAGDEATITGLHNREQHRWQFPFA